MVSSALSDFGKAVRQVSRNVDRGSGSVLALGLIASFLAYTTLLVNVSQGLVAQARLDAVADSAAMAAADALRGLVAGYPCDVAKQVAHDITSCRVIGDDVLVHLTSETWVSRARAGEPN